ncbi:MAG TPA: class II aldolase/adducin family protein [Hyphomicrobiaceae bacterium]|nr:class II aldolase/adducin family protein [Hyphomicrobiaceae bacterium]
MTLAEELVLANRILVNEGILDAFGHVSARLPDKGVHYLLSRYRPPLLVSTGDITEYDERDAPLTNAKDEHYSERAIHGAIYRARPDVAAVCHTHAPFVLPFAVSGVAIHPVYHMGACLGAHIPFWDSQDEFGDTNLLVSTPEQGASLARALGPHWVVILRRHGAVVAGRSIPEVVYRAIQLQDNARAQLQAAMLGSAPSLPPGEIAKAGAIADRPRTIRRGWDYWVARAAQSAG